MCVAELDEVFRLLSMDVVVLLYLSPLSTEHSFSGWVGNLLANGSGTQENKYIYT